MLMVGRLSLEFFGFSFENLPMTPQSHLLIRLDIRSYLIPKSELTSMFELVVVKRLREETNGLITEMIRENDI